MAQGMANGLQRNSPHSTRRLFCLWHRALLYTSSFHKPKNVQSVEDWESQNAGGGVINVHGAEAIQLNDTTVYVRYYAEGVVGDGNGGMKPYRTRVTGVWVKEGSNWVVKTSHFSSAAYGGTHQTVQADFED